MLSKERKGEIALLVLAARFKKNGINLKPDLMLEEISDLVASTGVPTEEITEFMEEMVTELMAKTFKK